jgi:hypothetical protein
MTSAHPSNPRCAPWPVRGIADLAFVREIGPTSGAGVPTMADLAAADGDAERTK